MEALNYNQDMMNYVKRRKTISPTDQLQKCAVLMEYYFWTTAAIVRLLCMMFDIPPSAADIEGQPNVHCKRIMAAVPITHFT